MKERIRRDPNTGALRLYVIPDPEFGSPTNPRRLNFYGHFKRGAQAKRHHINLLHEQALREDAQRSGIL